MNSEAWRWSQFFKGMIVASPLLIITLVLLPNKTVAKQEATIIPKKITQIKIAKQTIMIEPEIRIDRRNIDGLHKELQPKVKAILRELTLKGWEPRVAEGLRTIEQQKEKVRKGYSRTLNSAHLKGCAADIIDRRYGWNGPASDLDYAFWNDLGQAAEKQGLVWGGNWKSFKDVAHVELKNWRNR